MQAVMNKQVVAAKPSRATSVVVRASVESRRAVLGGFLAGAALFGAKAAEAASFSAVDVFDDRAAKQKGFDLIYEARELDLPQSTRDGMTQARTDVAATKARAKESESRIDSLLEPLVAKAYWTEARNELRRQVGTLRFDLNVLAAAKPSKEEKKGALALRKDFIAKVDDLDFALREKNQESAAKALGATKAALDKVLAAVL